MTLQVRAGARRPPRGPAGRLRRRLPGVLHVVEVVVALADACGPAEVVERDRGVAALGEAQRELLVEAVEPTDVREHDDPDPGRLVRVRAEGREAVAVATPRGQGPRERRPRRGSPGSAATSRARSTRRDDTGEGLEVSIARRRRSVYDVSRTPVVLTSRALHSPGPRFATLIVRVERPFVNSWLGDASAVARDVHPRAGPGAGRAVDRRRERDAATRAEQAERHDLRALGRERAAPVDHQRAGRGDLRELRRRLTAELREHRASEAPRRAARATGSRAGTGRGSRRSPRRRSRRRCGSSRASSRTPRRPGRARRPCRAKLPPHGRPVQLGHAAHAPRAVEVVPVLVQERAATLRSLPAGDDHPPAVPARRVAGGRGGAAERRHVLLRDDPDRHPGDLVTVRCRPEERRRTSRRRRPAPGRRR